MSARDDARAPAPPPGRGPAHADAVLVRAAAAPAERDALIALRFRVFVDEQQVPAAEEIDAHDATATHLVAVAPGGVVVGTARVVLEDTPAPVSPAGAARIEREAAGAPAYGAAKIGRVAVEQAWRGRGVGLRLVAAGVDVARAAGAAEAYLDAQTYALAFYERLGFCAEGPEFLDAGIPHRRMRLRLRPAPPAPAP
ncbi:MAG TPA: GNAT family N-acetyltransferase [Myxococcota bacterium]|nr:GNAT family N-acetyltransferase [Myxococcota bacterium]